MGIFIFTFKIYLTYTNYFFFFFIRNVGGRRHRDSNNSFSSIHTDNANGGSERLSIEYLDNLFNYESRPIPIPNANR